VKRGPLDLTLLYCGCYWYVTFIVTSILVWTGGLVSGTSIPYIIVFHLGVIAFIWVGWYYFVKLGAEYRKEFFKMLENKGIKDAKLECPEIKPFQVPKVTAKCPRQRKKDAPMEYTITFFYLCKESITIYTKCAKFHIFKIDRAKDPNSVFIPKYKNKEACGDILEYYFYYIQRVEFADNNIVFYFADGASTKFPVAKKQATPIIKEIRAHLRATAQRKMVHGYYKEPFDVRVRRHKAPKE